VTNRFRRWRRIATCVVMVAGLLVAAGATQTQAASIRRPAVASFRASPGSLPPDGGVITLTAAVRHATACTFTAAPKVAGLPATVRCSSGQATEKLRLPGDPSRTRNVTYTFRMNAKGADGTVAARPVRVVVSDVWPALRWGAPRYVDSLGGRFGALDCVTTTFCMATDYLADAALRFNGTSWSAPLTLESSVRPDAPQLYTLSCSSTTFCVAIDEYGAMFTYNGKSWTRSAAQAMVYATGLSCASPTFCAAITADSAAIYNGKGWSAPVAFAPEYTLGSVSCPAPSFCLAVDSTGDSYTYSGSTWSAKTTFDPGATGTRVSCATRSLCVAVDQDGKVVVYTGTWGTPTQLTSGGTGLAWVRCLSVSLCLAEGGGQFYAFNGKTWQAVMYQADAAGFPVLISCVSTTFCVVVNGTNSTIAVLHDTAWHVSPTPSPPHGVPLGVSCPTAQFCAVADAAGASLTYNGRSWSAPRELSSTVNGISGISCVSAAFCMAVAYGNGSQYGYVYTYNGKSWTSQAPLGIPFTSVSCTSPTFCVAAGGFDFAVQAAVWNGTTWQTTNFSNVVEGPWAYVSCASATFCVVVDHGGHVMTYNGSTWSAPVVIDTDLSAGPTSVSCPTARFCTVIDARGRVFTFNGATWAKTAMLGSGNPSTVSCTAERFCAVGDAEANLFTYNGRAWSAPYNVPSGTLGALVSGVSCPTPAFCLAVEETGIAVIGTA